MNGRRFVPPTLEGSVDLNQIPRCSSIGINTNHVASAVYVNLGARYQLPSEGERSIELFAGVQNLLDRDPPVAPSNQGATNMILFDPLGRSYRAGFRMQF